MSKEDDERWWNLITIHAYVTDDELADLAPALIMFVVVVIVIASISSCISEKFLSDKKDLPENSITVTNVSK